MENIKSENIVVRSEAIFWLGEGEKKIAVSALTVLLTDNQPKNIRLEAIDALGKIGARTSVDKLLALFGEEDEEILSAAVEAVGKIKDPKAVKPLMDVLYNDTVKLTAIWSLGNIGDKSAIPILTTLLNNEDRFVRFNATRALKTIGENG